MAATQLGTGSMTVGGQATEAAVLTIPAGCIVDSCTVTPGGSVEKEDIRNDDGELHTVLIFDNRCDEISVVLVGKEYTKKAGELDGDYEILTVSEEFSRSAVRTTITARKVVFTPPTPPEE